MIKAGGCFPARLFEWMGKNRFLFFILSGYWGGGLWWEYMDYWFVFSSSQVWCAYYVDNSGVYIYLKFLIFYENEQGTVYCELMWLIFHIFPTFLIFFLPQLAPGGGRGEGFLENIHPRHNVYILLLFFFSCK